MAGTWAADIPIALKEYIDPASVERNIEYLELPKFDMNAKVRGSLTKPEAREDVDILKYLLETAYSGRYYWGKHGIDFEGMYRELDECLTRMKENESMRIERIEDILDKYLKNMNDGHFCVVGTKYHRYFNHQAAYFSHIVVEKRDERYFVIQSLEEGIEPGMEYGDPPAHLFPTLSPQGKHHYLVGCLSTAKIETLNMRIGNKTCAVPLHRCYTSKAGYLETKKGDFYTERIGNIPLVGIKTFSNWTNKNKDKLDAFVLSGKKFVNEPCIILDIMNNFGGGSMYAEGFMRNLNTTADWSKDYAELLSPAIMKSYADMDAGMTPRFLSYKERPRMHWITQGAFTKHTEGSYQGQLILVMNSKVASSGEAAVFYARSVKNFVAIGENTAGIGTFGEIRGYVLPHSRMKLWIPHKIFLTRDFTEAEGCMPDLWLDSLQPVDEIAAWKKDPVNYRFVYKEHSWRTKLFLASMDWAEKIDHTNW